MEDTMRKVIHVMLFTFAAGVAASAGAAEAPRPLTGRDLNSMQRISDPRPSPDGRQVAYVVRTADLEANRGRFDIWLTGIDGSGAVQLTTHEGADTEPRWAPDGKSLYFLSSRSGSSQVWRLPIPGTDKDAVQVTDLPLDVSNLLLAPDGSRVAFSLEVFPDCPTLACTVERLTAVEKRKTSARVYDGGFYRHWDTWSDGRRNHPFLASLTGGRIGEPVDVARGMLADAPSRPFGGSE
jgi:dipeptidyl aminopeptidase/acylaminoacyl peptidase